MWIHECCAAPTPVLTDVKATVIPAERVTLTASVTPGLGSWERRDRGEEDMLGTMGKRVCEVAFSIGVLVVLLSFAPASALATDLPSSYKIEGVPLYQQIDAKGCGPVALQMIFDYYGEFIEQKEI